MASSSIRASFQWEDPFLLEGQLTADERAVRDAAQAFAQEQLLPKAQEAFRHEKTDAGDLPLDGRTRPAWRDDPRGLRRRGSELC